LVGWSAVSRAFVREPDGDTPPEPLAETPVSPHRNLVTQRGLALLQAELARLDVALAQESAGDSAGAQRSEDPVDGHSTVAHLSRDRRYVARRLATAEAVVVPAAADGEQTVTFGCLVTLALSDGRRVSWRIVGEDEADPAHGRIAWTAPVAGLLTGLGVGDEVRLPAGPAEVIAVDPAPEPVPDTATGDPA
jgi:transcription elongation GreA/GreB family factor